jgi:hypothetical protein
MHANARLAIAEAKISDSNAKKSFDAVSDSLERSPNLPVYSAAR